MLNLDLDLDCIGNVEPQQVERESSIAIATACAAAATMHCRLSVALRLLLFELFLLLVLASAHAASSSTSERARWTSLAQPADFALTDSTATLPHTDPQPSRSASGNTSSSRHHNRDVDDASAIKALKILHPADGGVVKCPLFIQYDVQVANIELALSRHTQLRACVEVDSATPTTTRCYPLLGVKIKLEDLSPGSHALRIVVADTSAQTLLEQSPPEDEAVLWSELSARSSVVHVSDGVRFTVLSEHAFDVHRSEQLERQRQRHHLPSLDDDDLVQWANTQCEHLDSDAGSLGGGGTAPVDVLGEPDFARGREDEATRERSEPLVVVGVKTSVVHGFAQRQGIRETWASASALHPAVRVVFLGCRPVLASSTRSSDDHTTLSRAVELEKRVFRDLLTHELDCDDSYYALADKVKAFMHVATTTFPSAAYVMVVDDDVYLRTHDLVALAESDSWPRKRLYAGHIVSVEKLLAPVRDPGHKNYLSLEQYPLHVLPPFAYGCHFVLSQDCAQFIGRNHDRLEGLAHLDDASVAFWMLTMQVHVQHVSAFSNLDLAACRDDLVSFADLSPSAMRIAHANLAAGKPFCDGFEHYTWRKASESARERETMVYSSTVVRNHTSHSTHVTLGIKSRGNELQLTFDPAMEMLDDVSMHALCLRVKRDVVPAGFACAGFTSQLQNTMHSLAAHGLREGGKFGGQHLALWMHNLQFIGMRAPATTVVYSRGAAAFKSMLECLLVAAYPQNPIRMLDAIAFDHQQQSATASVRSPAVVVFSISDCGQRQTDQMVECQRETQAFVDRYGEAASLIMVSGEPWTVDGLDERVLLLSTVADEPRRKHVYLPMASMVFSDLNKSPLLLLESNAERRQQHSQQQPSEQRKFCAYMYARCDRPQREYMFDLLNALEPVDALGVCQGSARQERSERWRARVGPSVFSDAVKIYAQYKFVIAFENAQQRPGYVTEKLTNAFLAGSVPVYLGHSDSVAQVFNAESFIDCGRFATLRACALRVMEVHRSPELYDRMLRAPVVANVTRFHELFSWHPDVPSSHLADAIAAMLERR